MSNIFIIVQIFCAVLLISLILIQPKGTGFARQSGGASVSFTRRGLEKIVFRLTFAISFLFIVFSILAVIL